MRHYSTDLVVACVGIYVERLSVLMVSDEYVLYYSDFYFFEITLIFIGLVEGVFFRFTGHNGK